MGWSLRKSIKLGPTRLNLSSRGVGASVGVRGFRVETSGGRSYVRAGRGMFRYQASLGGRALSSPAPLSFSPSDPLTDVAAKSCLGLLAAGFLLVVGLGFAAWVAAAPTQMLEEVAVVAAVVAVLAFAAMARTIKNARDERRRLESKARDERRKLDGFVGAAKALIANPNPTEHDADEISTLRKEVVAVPADIDDDFEAAYCQAVAGAVADQHVTPDEQRRLALLARGLGLPEDVTGRAHVNGFLEGFCQLVGDGRLTATEEEQIAALRAAFNIPESLVQAQLAKADQLKRARQVEQAQDLAPRDAGIKLKKGEACFHVTPFTERKDRVAETYVKDGVRYTERALEAVRSGSIYVTSERLLLVANGTTTIKLEKVLDVAVESRQGGEIVALIVDGRKAPYYFDVPEPFVLAAYLSRLAAA